MGISDLKSMAMSEIRQLFSAIRDMISPSGQQPAGMPDMVRPDIKIVVPPGTERSEGPESPAASGTGSAAAAKPTVTLTDSDRAEFRKLYLPESPPRFSTEGLIRRAEEFKLRFTDGEKFAQRKAEKLTVAIKAWDTEARSESGTSDYGMKKEKLKMFLTEEVGRYQSHIYDIGSEGEQKLRAVHHELMSILENEATSLVDLGVEQRDIRQGDQLVFNGGTDSERSYSVGDRFAAGSSGIVYYGTRTENGIETECVVKQLFVPMMGQTDIPRIVKETDAACEIMMERDLRLSDGSGHPRLAHTLDTVVTRDENGMVNLNIMMERLNGSASQLIPEFDRSGNLATPHSSDRENQTQKLLSEAGEGLAFMHSRGVIHRDIKPDNIG
ncbi:protein kinase family protein, partial [bacterium]|nr:protein kinase family protein [bacterium]